MRSHRFHPLSSATAFQKKYLRSLRFANIAWVYIVVALGLGFVAPRVNQWFFPWLVSPLDKTAMSTILSSIAAGMITLTGIVFSLVFVIVQFGSSTYSPRIVRIFAHTRALHHSLGIFTGTFLYSLMALRTIGIEQTESVSAFTVWLAFAWLLASIVVLAQLVRVFTTLTIDNVLLALSKAGQSAIAHLYEPFSPGRASGRNAHTASTIGGRTATQAVMYSGAPRYVIRYDLLSLFALAHATDTTIHLPYAVGDVVKDGEPIALVLGTDPTLDTRRIDAAIVLWRERAFGDDPRYALRLLVDTAIRALSPAINDPTTAVQALDHIEMLLRRLGNADLDIGTLRDEGGRARVVFNTPGWEDYLLLGLSEIMQYGATSPQVQRRLAALLRGLRHAVPSARRAGVERLEGARRMMVVNALGEDILRRWSDTEYY